MTKSQLRPIHSLIDEKLLSRSHNIQSLSQSLQSRLSSELRNHCWATSIIGNTLIIVTDNAERGSILRYQQHELLKQINEEFASSLNTPVRKLKVKIDAKITDLKVKSPENPLSNNSASYQTAKHHCRLMLDHLARD